MIEVDELVESTLNDQLTDVDIFDLIDVEVQAEMFREFITLRASHRLDKSLDIYENRSEWFLSEQNYLAKSFSNFLNFKLGARAE